MNEVVKQLMQNSGYVISGEAIRAQHLVEHTVLECVRLLDHFPHLQDAVLEHFGYTDE